MMYKPDVTASLAISEKLHPVTGKLSPEFGAVFGITVL